jgi:3-isopropylmalate/(R)-2-methylmalate dehydratase small subunit
MAMREIRGRTWVFGDNLNTDVIHPPRFFSLEASTVKKGLFHGLDPTIQPRLLPGDVLVAGRNFGCGSSRETSVISLRLNEIGAIIAISFARIFFRNATNRGLPCLTFADPADYLRISAEVDVTVDLAEWKLRGPNLEVALVPAGDFIRRIWESGGLLELLDGELGPAR